MSEDKGEPHPELNKSELSTKPQSTDIESAAVPEQLSVADTVTHYFAKKSGLSSDEVKKAWGPWIRDQLNMTPEQVIALHIHPQDPKYQEFKNIYERYLKFDPPNANALFWRDLLVHRYHSQPEFKKYAEAVSNGAFKETLTSDASSMLKESLKLYESGKLPEFDSALKSEDKERILESAKTPEQAAENIQKAQQGLEEALKIGKELRAQGYVPVYRYLFFYDNPEAKKAFLDQYNDQQEFQPQNDTALDGLTLKDISRHTDAKRAGSPLDSWTYIPPNSKWSFGTSRLARVPAVLLVSKIKLEELLKMKRFGGMSGAPEEDSFFEILDESNSAIAPDASLSEFTAQGKKGVVVANEGEITMWGKHSKEGLIDLGP